jgi:colicin import membrane protein
VAGTDRGLIAWRVSATAAARTMPRKLKTYTTSAGFFDLAVAAPSMKAALEAWGSTNNLFHQGFAKVSDDPEVVRATMTKPGVVLRRPVGTGAPFTEQASLPRNFASLVEGPAHKRTPKPKPSPAPLDEKKAREAAARYEREQKQREREARREEAAQEKERARRERAVVAAESALEDAGRAHTRKAADLEKARAALDKKLEAEDERWTDEKERLEAAVRRVRSEG